MENTILPLDPPNVMLPLWCPVRTHSVVKLVFGVLTLSNLVPPRSTNSPSWLPRGVHRLGDPFLHKISRGTLGPTPCLEASPSRVECMRWGVVHAGTPSVLGWMALGSLVRYLAYLILGCYKMILKTTYDESHTHLKGISIRTWNSPIKDDSKVHLS